MKTLTGLAYLIRLALLIQLSLVIEFLIYNRIGLFCMSVVIQFESGSDNADNELYIWLEIEKL